MTWRKLAAPFFVLYLAATAAANIATANLTPIFTTFLGQPVAITAGTFFIGITFFLRDGVQMSGGIRRAYIAILIALLIDLALSVHYGDLFAITVASGAALFCSELTDTAMFTAFRHRFGARVLASGAAAVPLDSVVFVLLGLSPLTTGIIPWAAVLPTILLQSLLKFGIQTLAALPAWRVRVAAGGMAEDAA